MSIDPREFRDTVGCFATGITIITTIDGDGGPVGLTANSFTSLSLDPPMVLFCLDRKVASFDAFQTGAHFAVNILADGQTDTSNRFAKSGPEKWTGFEFDCWDTDCPILRGCLANMECSVASIHEGGDHVIVIGEVTRMTHADGETNPLLYYRGRYANLAP
ncbi:MAG: flavin reductase family protein [Rhodospirillaceae bacterium]|nr:flavin reductase family protein [Rhodospirillaceae bacterium]